MKTLSNTALALPLLTVALLSGCGSTTLPTQGSDAAALSTQAIPSVMKTAEVSGRIGAWAKGRIGAWASGQEMDASTRADGVPNTFKENLAAWQSIHLAEAQLLAPKLGAGVVVAVIDTGLDLQHPAFQDHLTPVSTWEDFVANNSTDNDPSEQKGANNSAYGHGTAVANLILQVAPNAKIMPIRALTADGSGESANLAAAVDWAASHGAQIINVSATSGVDTLLSTALFNAAAKGIYITLAAGNEGLNRLPFPARNGVRDDVLGQYALNVGGVDAGGVVTDWSNYGNALEISAPGVELATALVGGYGLATGTSFASPVLAGTLALALGEVTKPAFKGKLAQQIDATGTNIDAKNSRLFRGDGLNPLGAGMLNAQAFLKSIK